MIATITIPGLDYKLLVQYINKHKILPETAEILGRVYVASHGEYTITAKVLEGKPAVLYEVNSDTVNLSKTLNAPICFFGEVGLTVVFDYDKTYE